MQIFLAIWLGAAILKLMKFPGLKDISWGWFILAPIFYGLWQIMKYVFAFAGMVGGLWCFYRMAAWIYGFPPII